MDWLSELVSRHGLWVGLPAVFLGGLALNFTPCVYPMIPVTFAFFSGQASGSLRRTCALGAAYVVGLSLCYALLGLIAARTGALFGGWLQQPAVLVGISAVMVALALGMFGAYELRPPQAVARRVGQASAGLWGAFIMGVVVGIVAAPCIGPFVLGLLLLVGRLANPVAGFLLFFALGLGMGVPYVALGVAANRFGRLPKAGAWLVWSKQVLGFVLLGLALYFLKPLLSSSALRWGATGLLAGAGAYLGWFARVDASGWRFTRVRRILGGLCVLSAIMLAWSGPRPVTSGVAWIPYSEAAFEHAQREGRPILIDVYADWCLPCVELDHVTFRHPEVVQALASVTTLRIDATRDLPPDAQRFLDRYDVYGVPTVLLFDRSGTERKDLRLAGFVDPKECLQRLSQLQ